MNPRHCYSGLIVTAACIGLIGVTSALGDDCTVEYWSDSVQLAPANSFLNDVVFNEEGDAWVFFSAPYPVTGWGDCMYPWVRHYNSASGTWDEAEVLPHTIGYGPFADLPHGWGSDAVIDADGNITLTYSFFNPVTNAYGVHAIRYTPENGWAESVQLELDRGYVMVLSSVGADDQGNVVEVHLKSGGSTSLQTENYAASSGTWSAPTRVSPGNLAYIAAPVIKQNEAGDAIYLFYMGRTNYGEYSVYSHRYDSSLMQWSDPMIIPGSEESATLTVGGNTLSRMLAVVDDAGEATILWEKPTSNGVGVYGSRTFAGEWQAPTHLFDSPFPTMMEVTGDMSVNSTGDVLCALQMNTPDGQRHLCRLHHIGFFGWSAPQIMTSIEPDDIGVTSVAWRGFQEFVAANTMLPSLDLSFTPLSNSGSGWNTISGVPEDWFAQLHRFTVHGDDVLLTVEARDSDLAYQGIWASWLRASSVADIDGDADVDYDDYAIFLAAFGGPVDGDPVEDFLCDYDGSGTVGLADYDEWLACYRDFVGDPLAGPPADPHGDSFQSIVPSKKERKEQRHSLERSRR